ncbi:MAG: energy-coupling factor ABC transporter ATP-binding protein [Desulfuromonadales bacterium]|nr:energy-coupling factor ABC transporter ATP-binding protein [Desulfuromonadales bacterium]
MLKVDSLTYTYPVEDAPALAEVSLHAAPGECLCLTGPSGCGKSTLLLAIKGLLHEGNLSGTISLQEQDAPPEPYRDRIGIVFQNPDSQILCSTVAEEVAFGPENLCVPAADIGDRILAALGDVGLSDFWSRNVERMSAGQKQRLAIASVLSMEPRLLLLDEPTSQLDATGRAELVEVLKGLKLQGYTILIAEHNLEPFREIVDRYLLMEAGRIQSYSVSSPPQALSPRASTVTSKSPPCPAAKNDVGPAIHIESLSLTYPGAGNIFSDISFSIARGERIHLFGQNGSGKSTLLALICGSAQPDSGFIRVMDKPLTPKTSLFGTVGFMCQNPQRQLFENTVHEEIAFSLKRLRLPEDEVQRHVMAALEICEASHLVHKLPLSLSFGEQHRVALASVLAPRPKILLLDEPFSGLDPAQRGRLLWILSELGEQYGTTVVIASHDPLPEPGWPDRVLTIENGRLG